MDTKLEVERRCDIATAKLSVAEELRWAVAGPFAFLLYLKYDTWVLAIVVGIIIFFFLSRDGTKKNMTLRTMLTSD